MLCGFPSPHFKDVLVNKLEFSCFSSYGFSPPRTPYPHAFLFLHPQNFCLYILEHRIINERNGFAMRHPLITQHQPKSSQIHLNLKIHKALGSIWAELTTCSKEFCDSEHVPDEPIDSAVLFGQSRLGELTQSRTPRSLIYRLAPTLKDPLASTNHICFVFLTQNPSS